jgi:hypothetical protein
MRCRIWPACWGRGWPATARTEIGQGNVNKFADMVKRLRGKNASANMGSSGDTLTSDLPGGVGAQPY